MTKQEIINETWRLRRMKANELTELIKQHENYIYTPILKRVIKEKLEFYKGRILSDRQLWKDSLRKQIILEE